MVPQHHATFFAAIIGATAVVGACVSTYITVQVIRSEMTTYQQDYLGLWRAAGVRLRRIFRRGRGDLSKKEFGLDMLAAALLLLAIVNIRNAWDLTLAMARHHKRDG